MSESFQELMARLDSAPLARLLNIKLEEISRGYARASLSGLAGVQRWDGIVHGGAIMSLADQSFAGALHSLGRPYVAAQLNIHFIARARDGDRLIAEARIVHEGRSLTVVDITITDEAGHLVARATATGAAYDRA